MSLNQRELTDYQGERFMMIRLAVCYPANLGNLHDVKDEDWRALSKKA